MDVELILNQLADRGLVRLNKIIGDYYSIYCPIHNDGNERKPSCGVLLHEQWKGGQHYPQGFTHCFSCSYNNDLPGLITDILKARSITQTGLEWLQENVPGFDPDADFQHLIPDGMMKQLESNYAIEYIKSKTGQSTQYISEDELQKYRYTVPYMYERKLTDAIIEKYDIGVDMNWIPPGRQRPVPCITFPVKDVNKNTLFIARRSIQGKLFNYPQGVVKPVYGIDNIPPETTSLVICESIFNALTSVSYGYPAVALLGTGNSYQIQQLKALGVREYVLAMDGDEAGRRGAVKLKNALKDAGIVWTIDMPDGKDVNDCTLEEFVRLYKDRS